MSLWHDSGDTILSFLVGQSGLSLTLDGTRPRLISSPDGILSHSTVTINRSNKRSIPRCREAGYSTASSHQYRGNIRRFRIAYLNHDEPSSIRLNRSDLSPPVTDAFVFRERNPALFPNQGDPFFIWCIVWKVVVMHFDFDPLLPEAVCDDVFSQIAV